MVAGVVRRRLGGVVLVAALGGAVVTQAADSTPPDFMPHPLLGNVPLAASGPPAFAKEKAEFIGQIAHLAQKSGYHVLEQRIYYCPRLKDLPDASNYPPWDGVNMSTGNALGERFGQGFDRVASASEPLSFLFVVHTTPPGYVLLSGYYLPPPGGGALIANTILAKN